VHNSSTGLNEYVHTTPSETSAKINLHLEHLQCRCVRAALRQNEVARHRESYPVRVPDAVALGQQVAHESPLRREDADAVVVPVCHDHVAVHVCADTTWERELALTRAL